MTEKTFFRICPLGAHVDHQKGFVTGFLVNKGISIDYDKINDSKVIIYSEYFKDILSIDLCTKSNLTNTWKDIFIATINELLTRYELKKGINGKIYSDIQFIGGLASSSACIISFSKAILNVNDLIFSDEEMVDLVYNVEKKQLGINVGKLDPSCQVFGKENGLLFLDTKTQEYSRVDAKMDFDLLLIQTGAERNLKATEYNKRVCECQEGVKVLSEITQKDHEVIRDVSIQTYQRYKNKLEEKARKRLEHYYSETKRVFWGMEKWASGNIEAFGELVFQSCESSLQNYESGSLEMSEMLDILNKIKGIYGGRFLGGGFNGNFFVMTKKNKSEEISLEIKKAYSKLHPTKESLKISSMDLL